MVTVLVTDPGERDGRRVPGVVGGGHRDGADPAVVGVPEIVPVGSIDSPPGSPVAEKVAVDEVSVAATATGVIGPRGVDWSRGVSHDVGDGPGEAGGAGAGTVAGGHGDRARSTAVVGAR